MSRNNVFKVSGNMALGSNEAYSNSDFENIKSSLKLLKSKQTQQRRQDAPLEPTNYYGGSYSSNAPSRQQPNAKNLPPADYQNSYNYPPNPRGGQQGSHKEVYYQMEQNYPANDYKQKRTAPQEYEQPQRNNYQKTSIKQQQQPPQRQQPQQQPPQQQQRQGQGRGQGSGFEQKSIKEVNRENRVEIRQYDPSELVQCSEGCGRKFNPDSIAKHENVCRQVFQKKRKEFNAQDQRLVANEQKKLMKRGEAVEKKLEEKKAKEKVPKWKADSLALRSGIKQNRDDGYEPTKEEKQILEDARNSQFTKCQFCGRSFNGEAAKKHIPFCESQQKKNQMRRK